MAGTGDDKGSKAEKLGYLGLGMMGIPMARRLVNAGFDVTVWNRSTGKAKALAEAGAKLALPVIDRRGKPLIMRAFAFGDALDSGQWGIREPRPDAAEVAPDVMLVPLLAFDRSGQRIGYGAGYYDMTIAKFRAVKPVTTIGIAYAAQEIADVPVTERDARLDFVLTEREVIDFRTA